MIRLVRVVSLLFMLMLGSNAVHAQVATGTSPFSSTAGGPDRIDLANLNVHLDVPIINKPGRGMNFTYDMSYDSLLWYPVVGSTTSWMPVANWGWRAQTEVATGYISFRMVRSGSNCPNPEYPPTLPQTIPGYNFTNYVYHDSLGVGHPSNVTGTTAACGGGGESGTATDGSGYVFNLDWSGDGAATVTSPSGTLINPPTGGVGAATKTDRNGNQISVNGSGVFTDSLGTTALTIAGSGTAASPNTFSYTAPSGGTSKFTMNYTNFTVATNFGASGITEYKSTAAVPLVSSIVLPDGSQYTFTYEATPSVPSSGACTPYTGTTCTTARLASVTLPTGGTISYTYTGGSNGIFADGTTAGFKRYTPDTGASAYWNYSRTQETGAASITSITDPTAQANQTLVQFQGLYETQRNIYQGAAPAFSTFPIPETTLQTAGLLKEVQICYNTNTTNCTSTAIAASITQRNITTHLSGASSWASSKTTQSIFKYNSLGSLIEQDDYDYGVGSPGSLLKKTAISYATLTNILAFRQQVTVTDGTGATVSQTNYNYGDTVTATSGTPQHTLPNGSRGNLLSVNYYTQGSTFLTKSYTYFDTGTVRTMTDVNGAQTTYTYNATGCPNSFPASAAEPLSLSRSMTWNCTGGVQTSATDENGKINSTSFTTDPSFWRPESATDPTNAIASFTYASRTQTESVLPVVSGSSASDKLVTRDSLGRPSLSQIRQTPGGSTFDTVETDYDITGRPTRSTLPFAATAGQKSSTAPGSAMLYDPLGRVTSITDSGTGSITNSFSQNDVIVTRGPAPTGENVKKHQSEYDALGRLVSVCEITAVSGSGTCSQSNPQTGFWTKYTYDPLGRLKGVTQNAQSGSTQSRSFVYDLMGRMTSETEAESGTTTYTYDTDTTCGTSSGDLVKKVDAVGNVTCYSYDSLHRPLSVTYPSGSYASRTPNKYFVYDSATVNSVAMANGKRRLVEAYTATTQGGTKITDIGLSYSVRGEPSDVYESTPNSGGYYHVSEQFFANGGLNKITALAGLPTLTFNPDGEGRLSTVTASTGQNPLTNTVYNPASLPTSLTYGSTDVDSYTYDPNTDRLTQYQFSVNSQSLTGTLTWNANSTLQSLRIVDAFNSSDNQTCNYAYDDLMRVQSANCGSVWSQTFSYDPFGNIAKSGSATFAAGYNSLTNRISSVGGFTPTYDANGNTLTDPAHTYTWDSAGKPVTIDAVSITYDALGRMAEQNRSGTYTQFVYGPHGGKFAIYSGQALQKAMVPLPGGALAVYGPSGILYYGHADHLGSIRVGSTSARVISFDMAYAPFGETYAISGSTDPAFTGMRQDSVAGLFDFPAREYSNEGRWHSPDPSGSAAFHLTDPQSLNRYAYARNTPLSMVDPTGLYFINDDDPLASVGIGGGDLGGGGVAGGFGPGDSPCICYNPTPDPTIGGSASNSGSDIPSGTDCSANPTVCSVTVKMLTPPDDSLDGSIAGQMRNDPLSMAILNSASDWVEAGAAYTAIVFGGILTGAASESVIGLAQSVDVSMPGVFDGLADIFNVMSPIPSVGTTEAGLIVNGAAIANQIIDHSQEIQDSVYQGWQWFNGDPVNESDKP
jgi:RHS repeat-associated protein